MSKSSQGGEQTANNLEKILAVALIVSVLLLGSWPQPFIAYAGGL